MLFALVGQEIIKLIIMIARIIYDTLWLNKFVIFQIYIPALNFNGSHKLTNPNTQRA